MIGSEELYTTLKLVLNHDLFSFDDYLNKVSLKHDINVGKIDGINEAIYAALSAPEHMTRPWGTVSVSSENFKLHPEYLLYDNKTIGVNKYGQLEKKDNDEHVEWLEARIIEMQEQLQSLSERLAVLEEE
jgi:hypothetical protein